FASSLVCAVPGTATGLAEAFEGARAGVSPRLAVDLLAMVHPSDQGAENQMQRAESGSEHEVVSACRGGVCRAPKQEEDAAHACDQPEIPRAGGGAGGNARTPIEQEPGARYVSRELRLPQQEREHSAC